MAVKLVNKLDQILCDSVCSKQELILEKNYGIKSCTTSGESDLDKNPKYQRIKKDFLSHYKNYSEQDLKRLANKGCDILKLIKKL